MLVDRAQRLRAVLRDEAGVEAVGRDVDGVHRLPARPLARVVPRQRGVGRLEPLVELVGEPVEVEPGDRPCAPHARTLVRRPTAAGGTSVPHDQLDLEALGVLQVERGVVVAAGVRVAVGEQLVPAVGARLGPDPVEQARGPRR